jgi:hypothetical protein
MTGYSEWNGRQANISTRTDVAMKVILAKSLAHFSGNMTRP